MIALAGIARAREHKDSFLAVLESLYLSIIGMSRTAFLYTHGLPIFISLRHNSAFTTRYLSNGIRAKRIK